MEDYEGDKCMDLVLSNDLSSEQQEIEPEPSEKQEPQVDKKDTISEEVLAHAREQKNKKDFFRREMEALMIQSQETIQSKYAHLFKLGQSKPELEKLLRYKNIYECTDPEEHFRYFETIYNRNRNEICKVPIDDYWIANGDICVQFGEGIKTTKEMEEKRKQVCIMLSNIYRISLSLKEQSEKSLVGVAEKLQKDVSKKDLIRPKIMLLHLYRIFYFLNDNIDRKKLASIVTELENSLGVTRKTVAEYEDANKSKAYIQPSGIGGGLSGIFNMATGFMEKMGVKPPPGMTVPTEQEIINVVGKVFNNEATQSVIHSMVNSLQKCDNVENVVQEVLRTVTDPQTVQSVTETTMKAGEEIRNASA
jgi:hypothetical protein